MFIYVPFFNVPIYFIDNKLLQRIYTFSIFLCFLCIFIYIYFCLYILTYISTDRRSERTYGNLRGAQAVFFSSWNFNLCFCNLNMSYTESSLMRLNKEDLIRMLLVYQGKFNLILDKLKNDLNELKTKFCKFESDMHISWNVNDKMFDKLVVTEWKYHVNEQYSRREGLEISDIPAEVGDKDIKKKCRRFSMQSKALLTRIWLRTTIVYPQKIPPKKLFSKLSPGKTLGGYCWTRKN